MQVSESALGKQAGGEVGRVVARNALYLAVSQVMTMPLSVLMNAVTFRYLGADVFGYIYLAATLGGFGFLAVEWGHNNAMLRLIARDRSVAGTILGTTIVSRASLMIVVYPVLALAGYLIKPGAAIQWAILLTFLSLGLASSVGAIKGTIQAFERADIPSYAHVGEKLLIALITIPVLLLGGAMRGVLLAQIVAGTVVLVAISRTLRPFGIRRLSFEKGALRALMVEGTPFVSAGLAMTLQPVVDAAFLSRLSPDEVIGWYAAARRLFGVLLFPAAAITGALYPTLCRLHATDVPGFRRMTSKAIHSITILVVPLAFGCGLFPEIGDVIFGEKFRGAVDLDVRLLSGYLFLLYFSMPLGTCILAAGKQRGWAIAQWLCVGVSLGLDPLLIPWFQRHTGNGGLGPCVAAIVSEAFVVGYGLLAAPRGIFDRPFFRSFVLALVAAGGMVVVARVMRTITPVVVAPIAVVAYVGVLWAIGGIDKTTLGSLQAMFRSKLPS
jgi:O-antigen/teichoic acid export membrane protein